MSNRELLTQALDALEECTQYSDGGLPVYPTDAKRHRLILDLRTALAQPAPEPAFYARYYPTPPAQPAPAPDDALRTAANALLHQIDIGDFVDGNGHSAKMLKATHDLMRALSAAPAVPAVQLTDTRKLCTCDGAGRGPGRACVVKAGGRLGDLWRCAHGIGTQGGGNG